MLSILRGYSRASAELIPRFEGVNCEALYAPVIDLFPGQPSRIADIGAGTGRDAAWLVAQGHSVLAVEPVREFRQAGCTMHPSSWIEWLDDCLPGLELTRQRGPFDLILLAAVWQHLDSEARRASMAALASMTAPGGRLVMSLRHGPGSPGRDVYQASVEEEIRYAEQNGFTLLRRPERDSMQAEIKINGVAWTWLVFSMEGWRRSRPNLLARASQRSA